MWEKLLMQIGLMLIVRAVNSDEDTTEIEAEIAAADKNDIKDIAIREGTKLVGEIVNDDVANIITDLAEVHTIEGVEDVINKPENKLNILQGLANLISGILKAVFGGK